MKVFLMNKAHLLESRLVSFAKVATKFSICSGVLVGMRNLGPRFLIQADISPLESLKRSFNLYTHLGVTPKILAVSLTE
ncbi:hypothetical protein O163_13690 [Caldanaerobacter subterraneus subsp. yonseiensis KB-1]|uniref:Uncharacterized protein n=1 Tax=Caldanaerobacter subterraneus subsp. yonseiensis KB-1 TaxID=1388761 RepID=U5CLJ3_CALSX|nr:hypothetical protein O163_13690 [Caldanaerobacter subterraneus subsp. yonseiensis KB-1]